MQFQGRATLIVSGWLSCALVACSGGESPSNPVGAAGLAGVSNTAGAAGGSGLTAGSGGVSSGGVAGAVSTGGAGGTSGGAASGGAAGSGGQAGGPSGPIEHHVMAIEYPGRLVELSAKGELLWEHSTPSLSVMFNVLPNGNVFFPHGGNSPGAQEVNKNHDVVWSYTSTAGELLGGERLANGNSLLGEGGPALALELDPAKTVVRSIAVPTSTGAAHTQIRHLHRLENGNILAALEGEGVAREFDKDGVMVWEYKNVTDIHEAIRLPNGNTLIGGGTSKKVLEVTSAGQIAWEFGEADDPTLGLKFVTSIQVLKNGNLIVGNWVGGGGGAGVHAFEVTREKKVVWKLGNNDFLKSATTVTALDD